VSGEIFRLEELHSNDVGLQVGQLLQLQDDDLLRMRNFGKKSLNEIKEKLEALGLSLGMKFDERLLDTKKEA